MEFVNDNIYWCKNPNLSNRTSILYFLHNRWRKPSYPYRGTLQSADPTTWRTKNVFFVVKYSNGNLHSVDTWDCTLLRKNLFVHIAHIELIEKNILTNTLMFMLGITPTFVTYVDIRLCIELIWKIIFVIIYQIRILLTELNE